MGVKIQISVGGLDVARQRLLELASGEWEAELLEVAGAIVESQSRRRIDEEKAGPDGTPWPAWSRRYAQTRKSGQSLLQSEGGLLDSIQYLVEGSQVEVGSNLVYAGVHQFGHQGTPPRPYLGLSDDNEQELQDVLDDFVKDLIAG